MGRILMLRISRLLLAMLLVLGVTQAHAEPTIPDKVSGALHSISAEHSPQSIAPAPVSGWYQGRVGSRLFYVDESGRYLFNGELVDLVKRESLTEAALNRWRLEQIGQISEQSMVVFPAPRPKHTITVFTDVDCGYCRKLHNEISAYHNAGISVRYLAYPRAGLGSDSYQLMQSVWCASDRAAALTQAKQGKKVKQQTCENPIEQHFQLGNQLGINGTPAILLESGALIPGYVPAMELRGRLSRQ
ncbi:MAG TPA: disulfide bond formation protein DsbC [Gammaproteobacteria bacterium]|nr:disulfide bond formation protein DsbC [Gammaproteobacteria bacterium]